MPHFENNPFWVCPQSTLLPKQNVLGITKPTVHFLLPKIDKQEQFLCCIDKVQLNMSRMWKDDDEIFCVNLLKYWNHYTVYIKL